MKTINVIPVNTSVTIGESIEAKIVSICISEGNAVTYKCVWWNSNARISEWIYPTEISRESTTEQKVGFHGK